jgi:hypothetical protein
MKLLTVAVSDEAAGNVSLASQMTGFTESELLRRIIEKYATGLVDANLARIVKPRTASEKVALEACRAEAKSIRKEVYDRI